MKSKIPEFVLSAIMISSLTSCSSSQLGEVERVCSDSTLEVTTTEKSKTDSADNSDNTNTKADSKTDDSVEQAVKEVEDSEENNDSTIYDKPIINKAVEDAVKKGSKENFVCNGTYNFYYNGISQVYSNEEMNNCFKRLADVCNNADFKLSFSFGNVETGATITYNDYVKTATCSTIKAPFVKSLLARGVNLDEQITKYGCWPDDDGEVSKQPDGTVFTTKQLIEYAITKSDNTAYLMLKQHYGYYDFNNMLYNLGANYRLGDSWIFTYSTTTDMLKCFIDIYNFGESSQEGKWLIELMQNTDVTMQVTQALGAKYKVAHKYGTDCSVNVFNDCAIVYADSPFVLCIFTENQIPETEESSKVFRELAVIFDDINSLIVK